MADPASTSTSSYSSTRVASTNTNSNNSRSCTTSLVVVQYLAAMHSSRSALSHTMLHTTYKSILQNYTKEV